MDGLFPVPGFERYFVNKEGQVFSTYGAGKTLREIKVFASRKKKTKNGRLYYYVHLQIPGTNRRHSLSHPRVVLSAKLGRKLKDWEQVRHLNGPDDNSMESLEAGCCINNLLDDIEKGTRNTDASNIDLAIQRLEALRGLL